MRAFPADPWHRPDGSNAGGIPQSSRMEYSQTTGIAVHILLFTKEFPGSGRLMSTRYANGCCCSRAPGSNRSATLSGLPPLMSTVQMQSMIPCVVPRTVTIAGFAPAPYHSNDIRVTEEPFGTSFSMATPILGFSEHRGSQVSPAKVRS